MDTGLGRGGAGGGGREAKGGNFQKIPGKFPFRFVLFFFVTHDGGRVTAAVILLLHTAVRRGYFR